MSQTVLTYTVVGVTFAVYIAIAIAKQTKRGLRTSR